MNGTPQGQGQVLEPTLELPITLQAQEWNQVLAALAEAPYRLSAPLIDKITRQANEQAQKTQTQGLVNPLPNGSDTTHPVS